MASSSLRSQQAANALATAKSVMQAQIRATLASGSLHDKKRKCWSTLKSATGSSRESSLPLLIGSSGRECHSLEEKSECFSEYFSRECSLGNEDLRVLDLPALMVPDYPPPANVRFRLQTVRQHLARLDLLKATGPDGISRQLVSFLDRHHLLPDSQYGLRQGSGTADVLTALQHKWTQTVANGGCVFIVAVDIAGDFDRVSHSGIVHKLQQAGATGFLIAWLRDYLAGRHLQVTTGARFLYSTRYVLVFLKVVC